MTVTSITPFNLQASGSPSDGWVLEYDSSNQKFKWGDKPNYWNWSGLSGKVYPADAHSGVCILSYPSSTPTFFEIDNGEVAYNVCMGVGGNGVCNSMRFYNSCSPTPDVGVSFWSESCGNCLQAGDSLVFDGCGWSGQAGAGGYWQDYIAGVVITPMSGSCPLAVLTQGWPGSCWNGFVSYDCGSCGIAGFYANEMCYGGCWVDEAIVFWSCLYSGSSCVNVNFNRRCDGSFSSPNDGDYLRYSSVANAWLASC